MGFQEVASLDAEVTIAIGKTNKETGKPYPKQAEGYYLGSRTVESKRGDSKLHFLQTPKGNLGVWGTTDLNRKLAAAEPGTMVRITSTGKKPTPNGDMYTYKVEVDTDNTIDVSELAAQSSSSIEDSDYSEDNNEDTDSSGVDGAQDEDVAQSVNFSALERKQKLEAMLKKGNSKTKN